MNNEYCLFVEVEYNDGFNLDIKTLEGKYIRLVVDSKETDRKYVNDLKLLYDVGCISIDIVDMTIQEISINKNAVRGDKVIDNMENFMIEYINADESELLKDIKFKKDATDMVSRFYNMVLK